MGGTFAGGLGSALPRFSGSVLGGTGEGWGNWGGGGQGLEGAGISSLIPFGTFCDSEMMLHRAPGTGAGCGGSEVVAIPGKPGAETVKYSFSGREEAGGPVGFWSLTMSGLRASVVS